MAIDPSNKMPSEELEAYNAAYTWRIECQSELAIAANHRDAKPEKVAFCYYRYEKAVERERNLEAIWRASKDNKKDS